MAGKALAAAPWAGCPPTPVIAAVATEATEPPVAVRLLGARFGLVTSRGNSPSRKSFKERFLGLTSVLTRIPEASLISAVSLFSVTVRPLSRAPLSSVLNIFNLFVWLLDTLVYGA